MPEQTDRYSNFLLERVKAAIDHTRQGVFAISYGIDYSESGPVPLDMEIWHYSTGANESTQSPNPKALEALNDFYNRSVAQGEDIWTVISEVHMDHGDEGGQGMVMMLAPHSLATKAWDEWFRAVILLPIEEQDGFTQAAVINSYLLRNHKQDLVQIWSGPY